MAVSQAASSGTAAIRETIVGSYVWKIDGFSATKDLVVGKRMKSSTFNVGGYDWCIECYPCGCGNMIATSLCILSVHKEQVDAECLFTPIDAVDEDGSFRHTYNAETSWRSGTDLIERATLESLLKDNCCQIRCDVTIFREFPAVPPPDLHRPLSAHRGLQGPSALEAATPTSAGSHVLTIHGYSKLKKQQFGFPDRLIESESFEIGERNNAWQIQLYPSDGPNDNEADCLAVFLRHYYGDEVVKVRFEVTLLTLAREVISSTQSGYAFSHKNRRWGFYFHFNMEPEFKSLQDSFHVMCDVTIVKQITPLRPPDLHRHFGDLLASQVGTDVEFVVGSELFSVHKCVLATRSTVFMAELFGPAGKGTSASVTRVHIDDIEPKVFKAFLHFIYTDTLPEVEDDDKVVMAQGLLVTADRYGMERLKLICGDLLCSYINDARTAVTTLNLADKHGCHRLKEACMQFLIEYHCTKNAHPGASPTVINARLRQFDSLETIVTAI